MFKKISNTLITNYKNISQSLRLITRDKIMAILLIASCMVSLFWMIPLSGITVSMSKSILFIGIIGIMIVVSMISIILRGTVTVYRNPSIWLLASVIGSTLVGSLFSGFAHHSFFGYSGEITSGLFIIVFCLYIYFTARLIKRLEQITVIHMLFIGTGSLLGLIALVTLFTYQLFPVLQSSVMVNSIMIGSWTDAMMYLGLSVISTALLLDFAKIKMMMKIVLGFFALVMIIVMSSINISLIWIIVAGITCLISLYTISFMYWDSETKSYIKKPSIPIYTIILFAVAVGSVLFSATISQITAKFSPYYSNMRPTIGKTLSAGVTSITHNPITGTGPNSFSHLWDQVKPQNISGTVYGTNTFYTGSSTILTWIVSSGIVGGIVWIALLVMIIIMMIRVLVYPKTSTAERYTIVSVISAALYLLVCGLLMTVGTVVIMTLALCIGLVFFLDYNYIKKTETSVSFMKDPRSSFFGILITCSTIIITLWILFVVAYQYRALHYYQLGIADSNRGSVDTGLDTINRAVTIADNDIFQRQLSQVALAKIQTLINKNQSTNSTALAEQIKTWGSNAVSHTERALAYNPYNTLNWINQGDIYRFMTKLGIAGTYDKSLYAYHQAQKTSPHDVSIDVYLAQLELAIGNTAEAKKILQASIDKQPTRDAYVTHYQIALSERDMENADIMLIQALELDPKNPDLYYEYGLFSYAQANYQRAVQSFDQVITLDATYTQAYYYLAVALEKSGNTADAQQVITWLRNNNPNTDSILSTIRNSQTGLPVAETPKKQ